MNKWRVDVNYNYPLESQDKDTIELQVTQFLCGVTSQNGDYYSRTSLKNALSAISRYLQDVKPNWRYNLHNKVDFPDLYARFDGLLKDMKKKSIGETKSTDGLSTDEIRHIIQHEALNPNVPLGLLKRVFFWICILGAPRGGEHVNLLASQLVDTPDGIIFRKGQQKNDQGGIDGNQFDLNIPFPPDPTGIAGPNHDIKKYLSKRKMPIPLFINKRKNSIASQSSLMSDSNSNLDVENELQGNSVSGFCTAKEIMQKDNYSQSNHNSAELDEDHTFKKEKTTNTRG
ncbi:hypothetical protein RhiirC2_716310 [Rhizophagus irregularis]|uniref:Uncharacterized protein n=1 Tax=Rhizophagus irregularis TaxID=588596 RepID=A0A2N1MS00_9GLOM|nr:hypothetical protein RhiirC2_716310 [Rhizophagus irregularis]